VTSPYYPPRARWYSGVLYFWFGLRRVLQLQRLHLPRGFTAAQVLLSFVLPGFSLLVNRRPNWGWTFAGVYAGSVVVFVVALGYTISGLAYGLLIAAHASSIVFLEACWLRQSCRFELRLVLAGATLLAVWLALYRPAVHFAERHWCMPLNIHGQVVVVRRSDPPGHVQRGDHVLYELPARGLGQPHAGGAVRVESGFGWGPVLALGGDRVTFSTNAFYVNGAKRPLLPFMPTQGEVEVPEKHWFVWPEFDTSMHGNVNEATISELMRNLAIVPEDQYIGLPCKHWFGRRQNLP
jgi:hypothetical protein